MLRQPIGLANDNGWSCFLISVLQALCATPGIAVRLSGTPGDFLQRMRSATKPINVAPVFAALREAGSRPALKWLREEHHQCAAEAMDALVEALLENSDVFSIAAHTKTRCSCGRGKERAETEVRRYVTLPLNEPSVTGCLDRLLQEERLVKEEWCKRCNRQTTRRTSISPSGRVVVLHLERFAFASRSGASKVTKDCSFEMDLRLGDKHWSLYAVLVHTGASIMVGHYVTYVRYGTQWYRCDDHTISKVGARWFKRGEQLRGAYLLFYLEAAPVAHTPPREGHIANGRDMLTKRALGTQARTSPTTQPAQLAAEEPQEVQLDEAKFVGLPSGAWAADWASCMVLPTTLTDGGALCMRVRNKDYVLDISPGVVVQYRPRQRSRDGSLDAVQLYFVLCASSQWDGSCHLYALESGVASERARPKELAWHLIEGARRPTTDERLQYARSVYLSNPCGRLLIQAGVGMDVDEEDKYVEEEDLMSCTFSYFATVSSGFELADHFMKGSAAAQLLEQEEQRQKVLMQDVVTHPRCAGFLRVCLAEFATCAEALVRQRCEQPQVGSGPIQAPNARLFYIMHLIPRGLRDSLALNDDQALQVLAVDDDYEQAVSLPQLKEVAAHWTTFNICIKGGRKKTIAQALRDNAPGRAVSVQRTSDSSDALQRTSDSRRMRPLPGVRLSSRRLCNVCGAEKAVARATGSEGGGSGDGMHVDEWWDCSLSDDVEFNACNLVPQPLHHDVIHRSRPAGHCWSGMIERHSWLKKNSRSSYQEFHSQRERSGTLAPTLDSFTAWLREKGCPSAELDALAALARM